MRGYAQLYPSVIDRLRAAVDGGDGQARAAAAAMLAAFERQHDRSAALLADRFGLTPTEVRLALHLGSGASLTDYAAATDTRIATVRQHLKTIFGKVGVNRQAQLVALVRDAHG